MSSHSGIILGRTKGRLIIQPSSSTLPNRNVLVVAGPGAGKTQAYVVPSAINERDCSIVVTDPKGEVYEMTSEIKRRQGYEVRLLNFADMSRSDRYNPLDYVATDQDAGIVANAIVGSKAADDKRDFWYFAQLALLRSLILYAVTELPPDQRNMAGILGFLQQRPEAELDQAFHALPLDHPARRAYELGFGQSQERTRSNILVSLLTTIMDFVDPVVAAFTAVSDFDLADVGRRRIALYVVIPAMDSTWSGLINLMFQQMFQALYKLAGAHHTKLPQPITFLLDEFPNIGKIPNFETFLATCRGYGMGVSVIMQSLSQLAERYGQQASESIIGNCASKICMGNVNKSTAEYVSQLLGQTTVRVQTGSSSSSRGRNESLSRSESYSYAQRPLMTPDEVQTMPPDQMLLLITGKHPLRLLKPYQYELFPGLVDRYHSSVTAYCHNPTAEMQARFEQQMEEWQRRKQQESEQSLEKIQEQKQEGENGNDESENKNKRSTKGFLRKQKEG